MLVVTCNKPLSWYWQLLILLALGITLACIGFCAWRLAYPWWLGLLLAIWLCFYTMQGMRRWCWRKGHRAITGFTLLTDATIELRCTKGEYYRGIMRPGSLVLAPIAVLHIKVGSPSFSARLLLEARHMSRADYRQLARMVREASHLKASRV